MGDPRFFTTTAPQSLAAIATAAGIVTPAAAPGLLFAGIAALSQAGPDQLSFIDNRRYGEALAETRAGAVILHPALLPRLPPGCIALATANPYLAWARVAALFFPEPAPTPGRHPSASIGPGCTIDPTAEIGALVAIGAGATIGPHCRLQAGAVIGNGVVLGRACVIGSQASVSHAILGDRVRLAAGVRVGEAGFGFATDAGAHISLPQLGRVVIGNDVDVGANTTIDRGSFRDTVIGDGCRLDNLVQIGHNVRLGRGCVIVALAGISGSTILEDYVTVGGQVGMAGHLRIGQGTRIGAQAGVISDLPRDSEMVGSPAQPVREFFRQMAVLRRHANQLLAARAKPPNGPPD